MVMVKVNLNENENENVLLNISKYTNIYLGPNNNKNWTINSYRIFDHLEANKQYKEALLKKRKARVDNWYHIDDYYQEYSMSDYEDYLNGEAIKEIDKRIENRHVEELNDYQLYLESISKRLLDEINNQEVNKPNTFNIGLPIYHFESLDDYEEPWNYLDNDIGGNNNNNNNIDNDNQVDNGSESEASYGYEGD